MTSFQKLEKRSFLFMMLFLSALGLYVLFPFLKTLILSIIFTVMFYPAHRRFLKWTKGRKNLSAFLSVLAVVLVIIIPLAIIVTLVTTQIVSVVNDFSSDIAQGSASWSSVVSALQEKLTFLAAKFEYSLGFEFNLVPTIQQGLSKLAQFIARYSPSVLAETANFFFQFFIMIILLYYLFRDGESFYDIMIRISPVKDQYEHRLAKEFQQTIYGVFYGSFLTGIVQGILASIGFYFAGVEGAIVWGSLTFFMSFIPIIGTAGVIIPLVLVLFIQGQWGHGIFLAVYGIIIIGTADNILKPLLIKSDMHPMVLFLSLFGGIAVFGAAGLLIGPIVMALLTATLKIYDRDFTNHRASSS